MVRIFLLTCVMAFTVVCMNSSGNSMYEKRINGQIKELEGRESLITHGQGHFADPVTMIEVLTNDGLYTNYSWVLRFLKGEFDKRLSEEEKLKVDEFLRDMSARNIIPYRLTMTFETAKAFGPTSFVSEEPEVQDYRELPMYLMFSFLFKTGSFAVMTHDEVLYSGVLKCMFPYLYPFYRKVVEKFRAGQSSLLQLFDQGGYDERDCAILFMWFLDHLGHWNTRVDDPLSIVHVMLNEKIFKEIVGRTDYGFDDDRQFDDFGNDYQFPVAHLCDLIRFYWGGRVERQVESETNVGVAGFPDASSDLVRSYIGSPPEVLTQKMQDQVRYLIAYLNMNEEDFERALAGRYIVGEKHRQGSHYYHFDASLVYAEPLHVGIKYIHGLPLEDKVRYIRTQQRLAGFERWKASLYALHSLPKADLTATLIGILDEIAHLRDGWEHLDRYLLKRCPELISFAMKGEIFASRLGRFIEGLSEEEYARIDKHLALDDESVRHVLREHEGVSKPTVQFLRNHLEESALGLAAYLGLFLMYKSDPEAAFSRFFEDLGKHKWTVPKQDIEQIRKLLDEHPVWGPHLALRHYNRSLETATTKPVKAIIQYGSEFLFVWVPEETRIIDLYWIAHCLLPCNRKQRHAILNSDLLLYLPLEGLVSEHRANIYLALIEFPLTVKVSAEMKVKVQPEQLERNQLSAYRTLLAKPTIPSQAGHENGKSTSESESRSVAPLDSILFATENIVDILDGNPQVFAAIVLCGEDGIVDIERLVPGLLANKNDAVREDVLSLIPEHVRPEFEAHVAKVSTIPQIESSFEVAATDLQRRLIWSLQFRIGSFEHASPSLLSKYERILACVYPDAFVEFSEHAQKFRRGELSFIDLFLESDDIESQKAGQGSRYKFRKFCLEQLGNPNVDTDNDPRSLAHLLKSPLCLKAIKKNMKDGDVARLIRLYVHTDNEQLQAAVRQLSHHFYDLPLIFSYTVTSNFMESDRFLAEHPKALLFPKHILPSQYSLLTKCAYERLDFAEKVRFVCESYRYDAFDFETCRWTRRLIAQQIVREAFWQQGSWLEFLKNQSRRSPEVASCLTPDLVHELQSKTDLNPSEFAARIQTLSNAFWTQHSEGSQSGAARIGHYYGKRFYCPIPRISLPPSPSTSRTTKCPLSKGSIIRKY